MHVYAGWSTAERPGVWRQNFQFPATRQRVCSHKGVPIAGNRSVERHALRKTAHTPTLGPRRKMPQDSKYHFGGGQDGACGSRGGRRHSAEGKRRVLQQALCLPPTAHEVEPGGSSSFLCRWLPARRRDRQHGLGGLTSEDDRQTLDRFDANRSLAVLNQDSTADRNLRQPRSRS